MKSRKGQMTCLGDTQGGLNCFIITHLTNKNHIRVFPQDRSQGVGIGEGIGEELSLVDDGPLGNKVIFNRVFNRHNMDIPLVIDVVQHAGNTGRFAAAGRTGDQDQAAGQAAELDHPLGNAQLSKAPHLGQKATERSSYRSFLSKNIGSEPAQVLQAKGEVKFPSFLKDLFLFVIEEAIDEFLGLGRLERRVIKVF